MKVIFTSETKEDFRKHNDYIRKQKKSDGHKYQSYELKGINKSFKKNLRENLEKIKEPKDSIFPKEFEYSSDSFLLLSLCLLETKFPISIVLICINARTSFLIVADLHYTYWKFGFQ